MEIFHKIVEVLDQFGLWGLIVMSFTESSFFPIPPDVLLIPMGIANPEKAIFYALVTTVSSVAGAVFGWWIGKTFGRRVLSYIVSDQIIDKADQYFNKYGGQTLAIAGFTPIPYKVFTILSGVSKVKLKDVILWSLLGRGARFLLEGVIIMFFGAKAEQLINDYFPWITGILGLLVIIIVIIYARRKK